MADDKERAQGEELFTLEGLLALFARNVRLVLGVTALFLVGSIWLFSSKPPVYRAKATLILDEGDSKGGVLGQLASLGKAPQASSEIEILRSRTTAEQTAAQVQSTGDAAPQAGQLERHLALATIVEDRSFRPLRSLFSDDLASGQFPPRLRAQLDCAVEGSRIEALTVEFLAPDRVRVKRDGLLSASDSVEAHVDDAAIECGGLELRLFPDGDCTGRTYVVRHFTVDEAVRRVLAATRVRETERSSGVIELLYDDSDPRRAAETANALCRNYLDRNKARGERKASQTVEFIGAQLTTQTEQLHAAETELVALQQENPRAIDVSKSAQALIDEEAELEVRRVQAQLMRVSLRQALDLLAAGDVDALSHLSAELADPLTATYIEGIAKLSAEYELQDRSDAGPYKAMLQERTLALAAKNDELEAAIGVVRSVLDALAAGDWNAVARLGGGAPAARDPLLEGYLADLATLQSERAQLAPEFTAAHPDRVRVEARIATTGQHIQALLETRLAGLSAQKDAQDELLAGYRASTESYPTAERTRIDTSLGKLRERTRTHLAGRSRGLDADLASLENEIARVQHSLGELPEEERRLADPLRRMSAHAEIVKFLLSRQQEAAIARASTVASADFIDPAAPPLEPSGPSLPLHTILGLLCGLAASFGIAFAKESLGRGLFTAAELESATELPVFGSIPDFRHGPFRVRSTKANFIPLRDDPEGPVAEAYRSLRANLKFALSGDKQVQTIAVTSCTPGEGKSMTNIGLALSFARTGKRVLLVDADMRRPTLHTYLDIALQPGLADVLQERTHWLECVHRAIEPNLDVISAGEQPRSPSDLLDSIALTALLAELRTEYDLIVFDVPPALAVSDIDSIAAQLDALLLLAKCNKVSSQIVGASARRLRQVGAHLIGTVLNAVGTSIINKRYGYGYGYGYGNGYGKRSTERSTERISS